MKKAKSLIDANGSVTKIRDPDKFCILDRFGSTIWHMSDYLLAREMDVLLDTETRRCEFADGSVVYPTLFKVTWNWYDRFVAFKRSLNRKPSELLETADMARVDNGVTFDEALAELIEYMVYSYDQSDMTTFLFETEKDLERVAEQRQIAARCQRKRN